MDHEFHSIVTKLAILEGRLDESNKPVAATAAKQEKPALFNFTKLVKEESKPVAEEASEDILSKVKNSLVDYLKSAEESIKQDKDLLDKKREDLDIKKKELKDLTLQQKKKQEEVAETAEELDEDHRKLEVGDRICVIGHNDHQGEFGTITEFAPSGKFVVVDLGYGKEISMHVSDVEYHDDQEDVEDWEDADEFGMPDSEFFKEADNEELDEDPTQSDPGAVAPVTSINPTYENKSELPFVETFMLDEVTECCINGDDEHGYEIRRGDKALPTRFNDIEHARVAAQLFKNRLEKQKVQDDFADYIDEK